MKYVNKGDSQKFSSVNVSQYTVYAWFFTMFATIIVFTLVVPSLIFVSTSNQYADDIEPVQNFGCGKINQNEGQLKCNGSTSILFDGAIGGPPLDDKDLLQYYMWKQELTPRPCVGMYFVPPLEEIPNITLYFYHTGDDIQGSMAINIMMCFLRPPLDSDCNTIEVPQLSDPSIGQEWLFVQ